MFLLACSRKLCQPLEASRLTWHAVLSQHGGFFFVGSGESLLSNIEAYVMKGNRRGDTLALFSWLEASHRFCSL